jgi:signal transduction histidine kinase
MIDWGKVVCTVLLRFIYSSRLLVLLAVSAAGVANAETALPQPGSIISEHGTISQTGDSVRQIYRDQQGVLWIATEGKVERLTSNSLEVLPAVGGISPEIVAPFAEDGNGGMFFITSDGLFLWEKGAVRRLPLRLAPEDAVVAVYSDPRQRVWLGTRTGVYELIARKASFFASGARLIYEAVLHASVHGPVTALQGDAAGNLWIGTSSDGLWRLEHDGLVRATPGGLESSAPLETLSDKDRSAETRIANRLPSIYQTWYFYLVLVIAVVALSMYFLRRKMQLMTGRLGIILEERNRIASECHDTLMAGFAAISWQLEATAKLFRDSGSEMTPAAKSCDLARSMVSHCQAEARRIIWDLRDTGEVTDVLSQALSRALSASHIQAAIETTLDVEGDEVHLAPGCVHHLVCIGQEAVSNAIRHAKPSQILVNLRYDSDALSLSIRDNGHGFLPADRAVSHRGHFGIPVMEERARKLGGSLRIQTSVGAGTEVVVKVSFNAMQQPVNQQHHVIRWIGI